MGGAGQRYHLDGEGAWSRAIYFKLQFGRGTMEKSDFGLSLGRRLLVG